jgi:hypothetical protein
MKFSEEDGASMEEEHLDELIRNTLAESRRSPEPPLDEMWAHIERKAFDQAPRRATIVAIPAHWSRWATPAIAAAAALVIGVGLGWSVAPRGSVVTRVVTVPAQSVATIQSTEATHAETPANSRANTGANTDANTDALRKNSQAPHTTLAHATNTPSASNRVVQQPVIALLANRFDDSEGSDVSRYLVRTAALLQALPADRTTTKSDTAIANRAAELLTQTHLLLDAKAGSDPTLHRLLEDLELVLAQVARLRVQQSGSDLQLIHQALAVHDVLPRVHDATVEANISD